MQIAIDDEVEKQRIVERKAAVTVRELKKQVQAEKKRADKLQEKIRDIDEHQIIEHERLAVPAVAAKVSSVHRDETSSIGSWSLPTEFDGITILTGQEAEDILQKNKELMEAKIQLEEQLRALEKNQIQMSEELANRSVPKKVVDIKHQFITFTTGIKNFYKYTKFCLEKRFSVLAFGTRDRTRKNSPKSPLVCRTCF